MTKVVFFGTPDYVLPILKALDKQYKIVAVVTQIPKASGRKKFLTYSAIDTWAHKRKVPKFFKATDLVEKKVEASLGIVASYGEIIPQAVIDHFPQGILNIHPSLLPKFRGASPIQATIISGLKMTGVTIIQMDAKLDHGSIVSQFKEEVKNTDTTESLRERLFSRSAEFLISLIPNYLDNKINPKKQDHDKASFTRQLTKEDGFIPLKFITKEAKELWKIGFMKNFEIKADAQNLKRFIRAMDPWPMTWTRVQIGTEKKRLKIIKAHLKGEKLILDEVQLEGKKPVSWEQFQQGYPKLKL